MNPRLAPPLLPSLALLCLAMWCPLHGQTPPATVSAVHFRIFAPVNVEGLNYDASGKDTPVNVIGSVISTTYAYSGPAALSLYRIKPGPQGKPIHVEVGKVDLAPAGNEPLLLLEADPANPDAMQIVAVRDDLASFPNGAFRFIDNTPETVSGSLQNVTFNIDPGAMKLVTIPEPAPNSLYVSFSSMKDGQPSQIYGNRWPYTTDMRTMILFYKQQKEIRPLLVMDPLFESKASPTNP